MNWLHNFFLKNNSYESALTWMFHLTISRPLNGLLLLSFVKTVFLLLQSLIMLNKKCENKWRQVSNVNYNWKHSVSVRLPQYKRVHKSSTMQCKPATKYYIYFGKFINQENQFLSFPPYYMALIPVLMYTEFQVLVHFQNARVMIVKWKWISLTLKVMAFWYLYVCVGGGQILPTHSKT